MNLTKRQRKQKRDAAVPRKSPSGQGRYWEARLLREDYPVSYRLAKKLADLKNRLLEEKTTEQITELLYQQIDAQLKPILKAMQRRHKMLAEIAQSIAQSFT